MPNYAIHDGSKVVNVIIADSKNIAEEITGLNAIETAGEPWIDWTFEVEGWRPPRPFNSWNWDGNEWVAPIPMPNEDGPWEWNEDYLNWEQVADLS